MSERLGQTEQLVAQLKELIREKDAALCSKDEQLKVSRQPAVAERGADASAETRGLLMTNRGGMMLSQKNVSWCRSCCRWAPQTGRS